MDRILIGLPDFAIKKVVSYFPIILEVAWTGKPVCPRCRSSSFRIKDTFQRFIKSIPHNGRASILRVKCHKHHCMGCGRYYNTHMDGIKKWSRSTELLKHEVFRQYNNGSCNKTIARENGIGVSSLERFYHQVIDLKARQRSNWKCPRYLGIDEHRFTRKVGFSTTFCDLANNKIFDIAMGRSAAELLPFLRNLKGRSKVKVVCIDMNSAYRHMVKTWFPNARIVSDRFHVIRLVNQHFTKTCKLIDEENISYGRGGIMRAMLCRQDRLTDKRKDLLSKYFEVQPAIESIYHFCHELNDLLRIRAQNGSSCKKYIFELLDKINQLQQSPFAPLRTLGRTLNSWKEEVARMFRYGKSNGTTEGFHRKMKLIQRRAYGFRNFENYRLRVRVLCG
ncbi:ISL3 family transposase [Maridesulfovibrio sp. FT414]|uniref:ISL3 family transposase n=1 Tax=Maridesulfovibrio sp. FT414 TaxID=2979469 RepID=UPI003D802D45